MATLTGPVTPASGISLLVTHPIPQSGYEQEEYFATGTARSYRSVGPTGSDGHWTVAPDARAAYKTRLVVRMPTDPSKFNGTVLVEWLNVTSGFDLPADLTYLSPEIERAGYAWVGISAQKVGVDGGRALIRVAGSPGALRSNDPVRYGSLHHPGDAFSYDIFSQVSRAIRANAGVKPLGPLKVQRLLAVGESQSAITLTTYVNAIQPLDQIFDGFFIHSRFGGAYPLAGGDVANSIKGDVRFRSDTDVPILMVETETDEEAGYFPARQADTTRIRLWDVAGASHADSWLVPSAAAVGCKTINTAPTHYVLEAALQALNTWVRTGTPPPSAPRMDVSVVNGVPTIHRNADGNAIGGIRTPALDVPIAAYSGVPPAGSTAACNTFGSTQPFSQQKLAEMFGSTGAYVDAVTKATDTAVSQGYILPADHAELVATARQVKIG